MRVRHRGGVGATVQELAGTRSRVGEKEDDEDKAFARAVNRDNIVRGAADLEMPLEDLIYGVITALCNDAQRLGLAGSGA